MSPRQVARKIQLALFVALLLVTKVTYARLTSDLSTWNQLFASFKNSTRIWQLHVGDVGGSILWAPCMHFPPGRSTQLHVGHVGGILLWAQCMHASSSWWWVHTDMAAPCGSCGAHHDEVVSPHASPIHPPCGPTHASSIVWAQYMHCPPGGSAACTIPMWMWQLQPQRG